MINIKALNRRLESEGASWRAAKSSISGLSTKQFKRMLGWERDNELLKNRPEADWSNKMYNWSPGDSFAEIVDWRNKDGRNYISPVKNQGGCGSCVAVAVVSLVESMALIEKGIVIDLSPSDLAFCGSHASDCGAWSEGGALNDMKSRGAVSNIKFPYLSAFPNNDSSNPGPSCKLIPNHDEYSVKITGYENIFSVNDRKSYLTNVGPFVAGISVYDDFSPAPGAIYSPTKKAKKVGGHCIQVIGYSDTEQYWLCKNSWGTNWGDNGFCKIAYGACEIDIVTDTIKTYFTNCEGVIIPDSVLNELILNKGQGQISNIPGAVCCDGFFSNDDNMRHSIIGTTNNGISEIFFHPATGIGQSLLTNHNGLIDLGSFYTDDDKFRHVVVAEAIGNIAEIFYSPATGIGIAQLGNIPNIIRVCGFYSSDDNARHAIVATAEGTIFEIFFGQQGQGQSQIGAFDGIVDIACFYTPDDNYRHVIVGTGDGNITEIFFHPQRGISTAVLANIPGLTRLSGFYIPGNNFYNRRVQILTRDSNIYELRYHPTHGMVTNSLHNVEDVIDIGGFFSPDDNMAHCILTLRSGVINELFYNP